MNSSNIQYCQSILALPNQSNSRDVKHTISPVIAFTCCQNGTILTCLRRRPQCRISNVECIHSRNEIVKFYCFILIASQETRRHSCALIRDFMKSFDIHSRLVHYSAREELFIPSLLTFGSCEWCITELSRTANVVKWI